MKSSKHPKFESVGLLLIHAARLHRFYLGRLVNEIGIFPGQEQVLSVLSNHDGPTVSQLADLLWVRPPTVSKMVTRLEAVGLVSKIAEPKDGRVVRLELTSAGRAAATRVERIWTRVEENLLRGLNAADRKELRGMLEKAASNLARKTSGIEGLLDGFDRSFQL